MEPHFSKNIPILGINGPRDITTTCCISLDYQYGTGFGYIGSNHFL